MNNGWVFKIVKNNNKYNWYRIHKYIDISNRYMYMIDKGYDVKVNIINDLLVNS